MKYYFQKRWFIIEKTSCLLWLALNFNLIFKEVYNVNVIYLCIQLYTYSLFNFRHAKNIIILYVCSDLLTYFRFKKRKGTVIEKVRVNTLYKSHTFLLPIENKASWCGLRGWQIWTQNGPDKPQMGPIGDFFR